MAHYDYVLFDADNTLFDFDLAEHKALRAVLTERGYPFTPELEARYLTINRDLWAQFDRGELQREALVVERFARLTAFLGGTDDPVSFNRDYLAHLGECSDLLPGAEALCRVLAPHCTLAIITNGVTTAQRSRFQGSALAPLVPWLFISQETGYQKPQKAFFDLVLQALSIPPPYRAVVVGDSLAADIQGACNAGLNSIWYNPHHSANRTTIKPTWEADSFETIRTLILG